MTAVGSEPAVSYCNKSGRCVATATLLTAAVKVICDMRK
jgi:hypothetical protein